MSENNNEQFKMLLRGQEANGTWPRNGHRKGQGFQGSTKKLIKYLGRYWAAIIASYDFCSSFDCLLRCRTEGHG